MLNCKFCNKEYKTYQSRSNHIRIYHKDIIDIQPPIIPQNPPKFEKNHTNIDLDNSNTSKNSEILTKNRLMCHTCKKQFTRKDNLTRHMKDRCKENNESNNKVEDENNELKTIIKQQSEEITQIKSILNELINKNCKVHPKTLQKINKQLNGDHNIINENNGTINNNTFIIALGRENLPEIFSKKEKINVLKNRFNSLPFLVEYTHFNSKYPQFKNILITNTQNNLAYKYDNKKKQFLAVNKNELLEDIVDERMCDINSFYEELGTDLDEKTKEILDKVKDKIDNDPEFRELKKKDIKLIIYNNRSKVSKENTSNIEL